MSLSGQDFEPETRSGFELDRTGITAMVADGPIVKLLLELGWQRPEQGFGKLFSGRLDYWQGCVIGTPSYNGAGNLIVCDQEQ